MKFNHIQQTFFIGLIILTTGVFLWMLGSYLMPVFWALVIAIIFYPLYLRIKKPLGKFGSIASLLTILAVILIILIPTTLIGGLLVQESLEIYHQIGNSRDGEGFSLLNQVSKYSAYLEPYGISQAEVTGKLREWAISASQTITGSLLAFTQVTFSFFIYTAIALYLLFFFFRDADRLQKTLIYYLPLADVYEKRLFVRFTETVRAVIKGSLAIAILQGILGGLTFWLVGISSPVLWGVVMAFLAIIPAVGPMIVWLPASIILLATGSIWEGVTVFVSGLVLVGLIDEFLRPILIGRGSKMPDSITLLATIGGLATFGISGFVVGPVIAAFFLSLWIMFGERYHKELSTNK